VKKAKPKRVLQPNSELSLGLIPSTSPPRKTDISEADYGVSFYHGNTRISPSALLVDTEENPDSFYGSFTFKTLGFGVGNDMLTFFRDSASKTPFSDGDAVVSHSNKATIGVIGGPRVNPSKCHLAVPESPYTFRLVNDQPYPYF